MEVLAGLVIVAIGAASLWQATLDPRIDRAFWLRSLRVIAGYLVFVAAGLAVTVMLGLGGSSAHQLALGAFLLGWFGLAFIWLVRLSPRLGSTTPASPTRWAMLDWILAVLAGLGFVAAWAT